MVDDFQEISSYTMKKGFNQTEQEVFAKLRQDEEVINPWFENEFRQQFKQHASEGLMHCFNNDFNKDDNGLPKHWPEIDEGKIHDDFKTSQLRTFALLEEFKTCNVPKNLTILQAESQSIEKRDNS